MCVCTGAGVPGQRGVGGHCARPLSSQLPGHCIGVRATARQSPTPAVGDPGRGWGPGDRVTVHQDSNMIDAAVGRGSTLSPVSDTPWVITRGKGKGNSDPTRLCREPKPCTKETCLHGADKYFKTRVLRMFTLQGRLLFAELASGSTAVAMKIGHLDPADSMSGGRFSSYFTRVEVPTPAPCPAHGLGGAPPGPLGGPWLGSGSRA